MDKVMKKTDLISPVTSLCFIKDLVLSGQGPYLSIHNVLSGEKILSQHVLGKSRIHAIQANQKEEYFAIFGQKIIRVLEITNKTSIRIIEKSSLVSFPDLILDVHWLYGKDRKSNIVAIATSHNAVWCFNWETDIKWQVAQCEENSILYSAKFFGNDLDDLLLASGTVFNQVLLWKVKGTKAKENSIKILSRLSGHEGVIFRINFNDSGTLMTTVSDDRSIRLWKLAHDAVDFTGEVEVLLEMYGHSARVWDAKMVQKCIVSIGEDAVCNVWNYIGKLVKTFSGHKGRSIWSLAINKDENIIATGGGDGSIRLFSLDNIDDTKETMVTIQALLPGTAEQLKLKKKDSATVDSPRSVYLVKKNKTLLLMTSKGYLYEYTFGNKSENLPKTVHEECNGWRMLLHDSRYSSYSLMAVSPDQQYVAFGNLEGNIKVHEMSFSSKTVEVKPFTTKVLSLLWSAHTVLPSLFSCGPEGKIIWWNVFKDSKEMLQMEVVRTFCIPYSKQWWVSSVEVLDQNEMSEDRDRKVANCYVVFGDRKGSIHLFDARGSTKDKVLDPVHSLPVLHGHSGVTQLCTHNNKLYSAGRDGTYRQYKLLHSSLEVVDTKKVFKGLDWVEKLIFTPIGDLLVAGFHTAYFIVWSIGKNQPLFKVKCGGGHRAWDFSLTQTAGARSLEAVFTYLKGNYVNVHLEELKNTITKSVLQAEFHGREATCMCYIAGISPDSQGFQRHHLFLTGSEDTTINLMLYDKTLGCLTKVFTAQGHISSVRALSITKCTSTSPASIKEKSSYGTEHPTTGESSNKVYMLFSGGGRASLRCWRIDLSSLNTSDNETVASSSPLSHISEYSSRSSCQKRKRKRRGEYIHSEIRFMSLSSFSLLEVMEDDKFQDDSRYLYGVAAACSDGFVRIFIFDVKTSKFYLLAQSDYLQRCVLTVNHFIHCSSSVRRSVLVLAGDTSGKISLWDITNHLLEYVREDNDEAYDFSHVSMETGGSSCSSSSLKENESFVDSSEVKKEKTKFSCINLVQNSLGQPLHVFKAHQSGVNDISLHKGCLSYILCSGGDDSALFVAEFSLGSTESRPRGVLVIRAESVQSAHTSSVTGVRVIDSGRIISSSTDQRLKLWNIKSKEDNKTDEKLITLDQEEFVDVPDVQAIETWKTWQEDGRSTVIAVCGVGLQMIQFVG